MVAIEKSKWKNREQRVADPDLIREILRSAVMTPGDYAPYLDQLEARGTTLPQFRAMIEHSFIFLSGKEHRALRRRVASFFSLAAVDRWRPRIRAAAERGFPVLAAADDPDLVRDFVEPVFGEVISEFVGFDASDSQDDSHVDRSELVRLIGCANNATEPLLPLSELKRIDTAMGELAARLVRSPRPEGSLLAFLAPGDAPLDPLGADVNIAISAAIAAYTIVQTMSFALHGLLLRPREAWDEIGDLSRADHTTELVVSLYLPTLTLGRVAEEDTQVRGCPFAAGQTIILDMVGANAALRERTGERTAHMSFGAGVHKCVGEPLGRAFIGEVLPRLANAFPGLALHRDRIRPHLTSILQCPTTLPCVLAPVNERINARMVEIRCKADARAIVNDDVNWMPPPMAEHLEVLQEKSGRDLATAIEVARNAPFFLAGARHETLRRMVMDNLGGNRISAWHPHWEAVAGEVSGRLDGQAKVDLVADFTEPLFTASVKPVLGIKVRDEARFDALAPKIQDVLHPWLPMRELLRIQDVMAALLDLMVLPDAGSQQSGEGPVPLLHALVADRPEGFGADEIKALALVLYGASFNVRHTLANVLYHILLLPPEERVFARDKGTFEKRLDGLIALCAAPKYIYRVARKPVRLGEEMVEAGTTARLQLLSINRHEPVGHLAFGHGLHRCLGAAMSRQILRTAVPALFSRHPDIRLDPQRHRYLEMSQTVALDRLPCLLS
ncbi:cytochrome P450 [Breoghania corrubedonensis]|uniref:Cytochrome P450 n=1 Tax=Breoghania corrubedonensis TaxID=665038 RepID=A0A2T5VFR5_9HYPH|nr:cytochrome P450 [Breoghania corrubedonensis]PTW62589.1 cytochrome P450 [Breoghania corrubedonensis]